MGNLNHAVELMSQQLGLVLKTSSFYQTAAWGLTDQPDFLNQCILLLTPFPPKLLMKKILEIEKQLGRIRSEKWGPRTIDIDILLFDNRKINYPELIIPHPQMFHRKFVLEPLYEIAPKKTYISLNNKTIKTLLEETSDLLPTKKLNFP